MWAYGPTQAIDGLRWAWYLYYSYILRSGYYLGGAADSVGCEDVRSVIFTIWVAGSSQLYSSSTSFTQLCRPGFDSRHISATAIILTVLLIFYII